jgi:hypothetical protein
VSRWRLATSAGDGWCAISPAATASLLRITDVQYDADGLADQVTFSVVVWAGPLSTRHDAYQPADRQRDEGRWMLNERVRAQGQTPRYVTDLPLELAMRSCALLSGVSVPGWCPRSSPRGDDRGQDLLWVCRVGAVNSWSRSERGWRRLAG